MSQHFKDLLTPLLRNGELPSQWPTESSRRVASWPQPCSAWSFQQCCLASEGSISCSKLVLADVISKERPENICRIYAIIDDQSNMSLITSNLADELGATGPQEKYYLTTCSRKKEAKYGRRVTGVVLKSLDGLESKLATFIECNNIPCDKQEIPTPEMARRFPHLRDIANEILQFDENAEIHLLIWQDAPALLEVRKFRNGPKGAPWAQKISLGWTIIGQMCLNLPRGPIDFCACCTSLLAADSWEMSTETCNYEFLPCPNQFRVKNSFLEKKQDLKNDVFILTWEDYDASLSCKYRKFLAIMETGLHKNEQGNWEMPLPFPSKDPRLPNNRSQALKWPHSHLEKRASDGKRLHGVHGENHHERPRLPSANRRSY